MLSKAPSFSVRAAVSAFAVTGALAVFTPAALAQEPTTETVVTVSVSSGHIVFGRYVAVTGQVSPAVEGTPVDLQYAPAGGSFATVQQTTTAADGTYSFSARPRHTGWFRTVVATIASENKRVLVRATLSGSMPHDILRYTTVYVKGALRPARAGRTVRVQRWFSDGWRTVASGETRSDGTYSAAWSPSALGKAYIRVVFRGDALNTGTATRIDGPVYVYRRALASWYGPGFFGRRTACGHILRTTTYGVAHKRLPCGTYVRFRYKGKAITVRVIDRGPYVGAREFDLTYATKNALGFAGVDYVWSTR